MFSRRKFLSFFGLSPMVPLVASACSRFSEGQPPASVNDSAREMMGRIAVYKEKKLNTLDHGVVWRDSIVWRLNDRADGALS